jgi:hypothetical protein
MTPFETVAPPGRHLKWLLACVLLAGCAGMPADAPAPPGIATSPWAEQSGVQDSTREAWVHKTFPGKVPTRFEYVRIDGRDVVSVQANRSVSMLRQAVRIAPEDLGALRFSWRVPALIAQADLTLRDKDDAPVRLVLAFEGDRSRLSGRDAALGELVRALTGEEMPYATLMYVWCNKRESGSVIHNPRTDRIRKICLESGPSRLNRWLDYERDIRADFQRAFGEAPGTLVGLGLMTDSDNTGSRTSAWYGPVSFQPVAVVR